MKRPSISIGTEAAAIDYAGYWLAMMKMVLLPFRCVAAIFRFAWKAGLGIVPFMFRLFVGIVGLTVIAFFAYCLIRTIFYPLFH